MMQILPLAIAFALAVSVGAEGATPRKRGTAAQERTPPQAAQEQDEFRACDVAVREFVQGERRPRHLRSERSGSTA